MARPIYQYRPVNNESDRAIGVKLPFNKAANSRTTINGHYASGSANGGGVFVSSYSTEEQAVSNFRNLLLTQKGERVFQPNFGTNIQRLLFEQNTSQLADAIESELAEDIAFWLPYISLTSLDVLQEIDQHRFLIRISFRVNTTGANLVINVLADENQVVVSEAAADTAVPTTLTQVGTFGSFGGLNV
jgi:phage baseplate assembly protein W